jgi:AcrR family transcriptional regulator
MAKRKSADERRRQIAAAAGELFAERGVQATTVRDIGDRVGILSGSLYHHFKTKNDIVHELMRSYGSDILERYGEQVQSGGSARGKLERLFGACVRVNLEYPNETTILIHELGNLFLQEEFEYIQELLKGVEEIFVQVLVRGMSAGELRADLDPSFVYRMMMDVMGAVHRWYDPQVHSEEQVVKGWLDVFLSGISVEAQP